jgi:hypothetical protein
MGSFIFDNRDSLSEFHYIRKAGADDYWCDISLGKLKNYIAKFDRLFEADSKLHLPNLW